jgi:KUP system potassium uptake protein
VPAALRQAAEQGLEVEIDIDNATYFVSKITIVRGDAPGMRPWRKKLFLAMANTAISPVEIFCLPERRIVTIGSYVEF